MSVQFQVKDNPTHADAVEGRDLLWKAFSDFEYQDPAQARATALLGTMVAAHRPTLDTAPGIAISAPAASSGKTMLCQGLAIIATGDPVAPMTLPGNFEEQGKSILAAVRDATGAILFDNLTSRFDSASLCAVITSGFIKGRELGHSRTLEIKTRDLILVNGNGLSMAGDVSSRFLYISLAPSRERPQDRAGGDFRIKDLKAWVRENRLRLISAAMTITRAYIQEVQRTGLIPRSVTDRRIVQGCRFPAIEVFRDALLWCGEGDGFQGFRAASEHDGEREERRLVFDVIAEALASINQRTGGTAGAPATARLIADAVHSMGQTDSIDQIVSGARSTGGLTMPLSPVLLGRWLTRHLVGVVFDGKRLKKQNIHNQGHFSIEEVKS
jgi:hypothetical protein